MSVNADNAHFGWRLSDSLASGDTDIPKPPMPNAPPQGAIPALLLCELDQLVPLMLHQVRCLAFHQHPYQAHCLSIWPSLASISSLISNGMSSLLRHLLALMYLHT